MNQNAIAGISIILVGIVFLYGGYSSAGGVPGTSPGSPGSTGSTTTNTTSTAPGSSSSSTSTYTSTSTSTVYIKTTPTMTISCSPGVVSQTQPTTSCTVQLVPTQTYGLPTGVVQFTANGFNPASASCTLSSSTCSVSFSVPQGGGVVQAVYQGDAYDFPQQVGFTVQTYQSVPLTILIYPPVPGPYNAGMSIQFTASGCSGCTYTWAFGDGTTVTGSGVYHTFAAPGNYNVQVSAQGGNQIGQITTQAIVVAPSSTISSGQALLTVEVVGSSTNGPIAGATVTVNGMTATTNAYGQATFTMNPGAYTVSASATGFQSNSQSVGLGLPGVAVAILLQANGCGVPGKTCPQGISSLTSLGGALPAGIQILFGAGLLIAGLVVASRGKVEEV